MYILTRYIRVLYRFKNKEKTNPQKKKEKLNKRKKKNPTEAVVKLPVSFARYLLTIITN